MTDPNPLFPKATEITKNIANKLASILSRVATLLKTSRNAQIIAAATIIIIVSLAGSLIIGLMSKRNVAYQQPQFFHPSPSPRPTTRYANHPTILEIEQELPNLESSISSQIIHKHPLLPPSLDMEVTLIQ